MKDDCTFPEVNSIGDKPTGNGCSSCSVLPIETPLISPAQTHVSRLSGTTRLGNDDHGCVDETEDGRPGRESGAVGRQSAGHPDLTQ